MFCLPTLSGHVLLLDIQSEHPHLQEGLKTTEIEIRDLAAGMPPLLPDLVITDREGPTIWREQYADAIGTGQVGVIGVGEVSQVDVCLPRNCTAREVHLAVALLMQIVALRREHRQSRADQANWMSLALRDALTGLPNRRAWQQELPLRLTRFPGASIALLDVDFFKQVNQQEGHHVGDAVLRELAVALKNDLRSDDYVARLGGDEFGLVLDRVDAESVREILDRVRHSASQHLVDQSLPAPTLSAGCLVCLPTTSRDAEQVFASASAALREAKNLGRNRTVVFAPQQSH
jgi:diguanylate cyclase (GGDEF)-like protein